ncbi:MAG: hypothetical protein QFX40_08190 [Archaeoglobales archaeon]|nr:hypothetical protein [Archaeoglobales archaeon]
MKVIAEISRILKSGKHIDPEVATEDYIGFSKIPKMLRKTFRLR